MNGNKVDFSGFSFTLEGNKLSLDNAYYLTIIGGELYLQTPLYSGYMKNGEDNSVIDTKTAALFLLYIEISSSSTNSEKMSYIDFIGIHNDFKGSSKAGVPFRNRQCGNNHAVEFGWSKSGTAADLQRQLGSTDFYNGCTPVGGISTSCVTDEHICMSSQTYNCPC